MLSSSLRRVTWARPVPIPGVSRTSRQALAASANVRRRSYSSSSSKPSDGPRKADASSQTPAKASRRKGKDGNGRNGSSKPNQNTAFSNLPSVPSTQHRQPHDVHVASFFSLHRPISVSTTVPPPSNPETFDAIFSKKPSKPTPDDVIFTLSSAVESMENSAADQDDHPQLLGRGGSLNHFDGEGNQLDTMNMADLKVSVDDVAKQFRPFQPPPPPAPFVESKKSHQIRPGTADPNPKGTSSYTTVLTIRESTHPDGRTTYEAHTTPFVRNEMETPNASDTAVSDPRRTPVTYMERLRRNRPMQAMSTRRRRRLKMKKHKWKKRLRLTRSIRQKLDKT